MTRSSSGYTIGSFGARIGALVAFATLSGCTTDDGVYYNGDPNGYYGDPNGNGDDGPSCEPGIDPSDIDRGYIRELDAGEGIGGTIEYSGDGHWRVAVTCDHVANPEAEGQPCEWIVLIGALEGNIDSFEPDGLELSDVIEWYPGTAGSSVEDAVRLESITDVDIDAFRFETSPGAGIWVSSRLDGFCGEPFLVWLSGGSDESTTSEMVELVPSEP